MPDHPPPATRLHDVVVVHEQTRAQWRAGQATIRNGRIVIAGARPAPPEGLFDAPAATYSILALDGGERRRCFAHLILARAGGRPSEEYVFD